ncbi:MAG: PhzF family phenazine biosynthesis protein [Bacteroidia bacterium]
MAQHIYQVDAFTTGKAFSGNPASVVPLESWPDDDLLQNIAMENNQAETAFFVKQKEGYHLRWFTPAVEVDLCGHATLAAAHVLFEHLDYKAQKISFNSRSGVLTVEKLKDGYSLDFPSDTLAEISLSPNISACFDLQPLRVFKGKTDYMLVFNDEQQIRGIKPDFTAIAALPARGVIITSPGITTDFVSRFFAPQVGISEDPVTGSAHTSLTPYWSKILNKKELTALQLSKRRGSLKCTYLVDRVEIRGAAKTYLSGEISTD